MAITPRPYIWKEAQLINDAADETGATFHFYDTMAEVIYPNSGLKYKYSEIPEGHWEEMDLSEEAELEDVNYEFIKSDHPATGSLYMIGLKRTASHDTLYLFRYDYMRDMSNLVENILLTMQSDNPIAQITASVKNINDKLFTKDSTLFVPSSKLIVGIAYGDSMINTLATGYADEITWKHGRPTVSITGRNTVGYMMNGQTFDNPKSFKGTAQVVLNEIFEHFGITRFAIDNSSNKEIEFDVSASDTGMKALQIIADLMSDIINNLIWDTEEMYDGTIICGYAQFRSSYNPKGNYIFHGKNDVFSTDIVRSIDGTYSHIRVTGVDKNGNELNARWLNVTSRKFWTPSAHRTYHAPRLEGVKQEELDKYAEILATQLKESGQTAKYQSTLRPQLLIGDVAKIQAQGDETEDTLLGIVTEIRHSMGVKGFTTDFTAATGGEIHAAGNNVYTKSKGVNGSNRTRRVSDFISNPTEVADVSLNAQPATAQPKLIARLWAQMDGSDFVRLPYHLESNYQIIVDFELDQTAMAGSNPHIAIIGTVSGANYMCLIAERAGYYLTSIGTTATDFLASTTGRHVFFVNKDNGEYPALFFDDTEISRYFPRSLEGMMYLGKCEGVTNKFVGKIYRYQIIDNDTSEMVMNLRPYEYISADGAIRKVGLLDLVSNVFYTCEGMTVGGYS